MLLSLLRNKEWNAFFNKKYPILVHSLKHTCTDIVLKNSRLF